MKRRNILRAAAAGRSLGVCVCTAGFVLGPLIAAVPAVQAAPSLMEAGQGNQASRNLRQLRDEVEWRRLEGEVNSLEAQRLPLRLRSRRFPRGLSASGSKL